MEEVRNILKILKRTLSALRRRDASKIKHLSNQTINTASRTQDADNISVAVIVYSLGKILEREKNRDDEKFISFLDNVELFLEKSIKALKEKNFEEVRNNLELIRKEITNLSGKLREYIKEVFRRAQVNKASRIYEHGISMERTAKLLGITMFELAEYSGGTRISETKESKTISEKERIKLALDIFS